MALQNPFKKKKKIIEEKMPGIFFGPEFKDVPAQERMDMVVSFLIKAIPAIKELLKDSTHHPSTLQISGIDPLTNNPVPISPEGVAVARMYDFFQNYDGSVSRNDNFTISTFNNVPAGLSDKDKRIKMSPKDAFKELEHFPTPDLLKDLDEKIETLKDKSSMLNQRYAKQQIDALVKRLENRRKYMEQEAFFKLFPNTDDEKIDNLLSKYKLVIKTHDLFVPTFPKEAIDVMKEYTRVTKEVCGEEPVYYVIAEESDFKQKFKKLDPILLVQSPFGFWWQVLGAWDNEMLLLSEL